MAQHFGRGIHLRENGQPGSPMAVWDGAQSLECCALFPVLSLSVADCSGLLFLVIICKSVRTHVHLLPWVCASKCDTS